MPLRVHVQTVFANQDTYFVNLPFERRLGQGAEAQAAQTLCFPLRRPVVDGERIGDHHFEKLLAEAYARSGLPVLNDLAIDISVWQRRQREDLSIWFRNAVEHFRDGKIRERAAQIVAVGFD